jgi:hypothetical protein
VKNVRAESVEVPWETLDFDVGEHLKFDWLCGGRAESSLQLCNLSGDIEIDFVMDL